MAAPPNSHAHVVPNVRPSDWFATVTLMGSVFEPSSGPFLWCALGSWRYIFLILQTVKILEKGIHHECSPSGRKFTSWWGARGRKHTYGDLLRRDLWILIFFIDLIHGLFQEGRRLLAVCITQSCPVPTVTSWFHKLCFETFLWQDNYIYKKACVPWAGHTCTTLNHGRYNRISHFVTSWGWEKEEEGVEVPPQTCFCMNLSPVLTPLAYQWFLAIRPPWPPCVFRFTVLSCNRHSRLDFVKSTTTTKKKQYYQNNYDSTFVL